MSFKEKYLKYKNKYKGMTGGDDEIQSQPSDAEKKYIELFLAEVDKVNNSLTDNSKLTLRKDKNLRNIYNNRVNKMIETYRKIVSLINEKFKIQTELYKYNKLFNFDNGEYINDDVYTKLILLRDYLRQLIK